MQVNYFRATSAKSNVKENVKCIHPTVMAHMSLGSINLGSIIHRAAHHIITDLRDRGKFRA